ncbi:flavodoxin [bacterium D16-51]|nr:flavodoxin [bacterium D16-59]RKI57074.1 flavodoxin [bacterium D16-51]
MTAGFIILSVAVVFILTACGSEKKETASDAGSASVENGEETSGGTNAQESPEVSDGKSEKEKILIAYFTWADNTKVDNPDAVDVDASTSASVLPPGNAAMLAGWIQEEAGGDLFSIQVTEPYSSDYDECLDRAADEEAKKARPPLKSRVEDMDSYDIVFLGFPNWWYTIPMAIHSFVEEYDFSGKTVIPFVTHGTGGLASCIDDLKSALPGSVTVLEPIGIYRDDVKSAKPKIQKWIADWRNG